MVTELSAQQLIPAFSLDGLPPFSSTADLREEPGGIIGQERAVKAMEFGLRARGSGYHIYVAGPVGTGRSTYVRSRLTREAEGKPTPPDWCYVFNFSQPDRPRLISLPAGEGRRLQRDMDRLVTELRRGLAQAFESREYEAQRSEVLRTFERRSEALWNQLEREARSMGFALQRGPTGIATVPLGPQGQPLTAELFELLPPERQKALLEQSQALAPKVSEAFRLLRQWEREAREALRQLERETAAHVAASAVEHLKEAYAQQPAVQAYLDEVAQDVADHLELFRSEPSPAASDDPWQRYRVNVFVDHSTTRGAPVVAEPIASLGHLVGRIEFRPGPAAAATDHTLLRAGALQRASGGYLVLQLKDVLAIPGAYEALKRCLRDRKVHLDGSSGFGPWPFAVGSLAPEPMPLDVNVVLIGPSSAYQALLLHDEDFRKLFKVKVEFEPDMPASPENLRRHVAFLASACRREGMPPLSPEAVQHILRYSARLAEDQEKLSARFNEMIDLVVSAGVLAQAEGAERTQASHVREALRSQRERAAAVEDRLLEWLRQGTILVSTDGQAVGQVNGLAVVNLGDYRFGRPLRITARVWPGRRGVIHVERETHMSGPTHSKGVLTIAAYVAGQYANQHPLCLSASLAVEQMYEEIEGDSASSAELYALLSELANLPLRQDVAVTGSVNQKGEIQPIGGVNEKIEGFFRCCLAAGLTGRQGVIIPQGNIRQLVLSDDVVEAVAKGQFHIWAIRHVDEGLEILTGAPAGQADAAGTFPPETVHGRVAARLSAFARGFERLNPQGLLEDL